MSIPRRKAISVIGMGYVGLTTAVGFGLRGYEVIGIDVDEGKVEKIARRVPFLYEEGLASALQSVRLRATTNWAEIPDSDVTFLCVGTPSNPDGTPNLSDLKRSVEQLAGVLKQKRDYHLVVVTSTVLPGTTEELVVPAIVDSENRGVCVNPEFLSEGTALQNFLNPSRIVIGELDQRCGDILCDLYRGFGCPVLRTDMKTAEMIKYASNAFLATKISFINEVGNICKKLGIDTYEVARGMGYDERIGGKFLNAGIGFGGSCLPKDVKALIAAAKKMGYQPQILEQVLQVNDEQPLRLVELVKKHVSPRGKTIGILGLAFKPGTDDIRESKAIAIVETLLKEGAHIRAYDPRAMANFRGLFPEIEYVDAEQVLESDAILILTEWTEFDSLDYTGNIVIDGRRIPKANEAKTYEGICW